MAYAIISLGGKQYRVQEGERLMVDRLKQEEGNTLSPAVLMVGGDGPAQMSPRDMAVTARVVRHLRGDKVVIGKYRQRTGYRRHTGFRAALTQIEIETIGKAKAAAAPKKEAAPAPEAAAAPKAAAPAPEPEVAPEPEAPEGMPQGYEGMTVADINEGAKQWNRPMLEAALEYEQAHAKRKGALAAIESALAKKETAEKEED